MNCLQQGDSVTSTDKRFAVFGAGALGCYFAAVLARSGHPVAVIARGPHLAAIRRSGICVESSKESFTVVPQQVSDAPVDIGHVDAVILAVKAWQVPEAARAMRPLLMPTTKVLPLQNGVEASEQLQEVLGKPYPLFGLCRIVSVLVEPGRVRHVALQPTIALGETDGGSLSPNAQALADALASAGVAVQTPPNIQAALWEKLLFIAALSGIGTVARATVGEIRQCSPTRDLMQQVMEDLPSRSGGSCSTSSLLFPVFCAFNQAAFYRVAMNIAQLRYKLRVVAGIAVVIAFLPERRGFAAEPTPAGAAARA